MRCDERRVVIPTVVKGRFGVKGDVVEVTCRGQHGGTGEGWRVRVAYSTLPLAVPCGGVLCYATLLCSAILC